MSRCLRLLVQRFRALARTKWAFWGVVLVYASVFAPEVDLFFRPIVADFRIEERRSYREGPAMFLEGRMRILRKGNPALSPEQKALESRCEYQSVAVRDQAGQKLKLWLLDAPADGSTSEDRPDGDQPWGPWRIGIATPAGVTATSGEATHLCRLVWLFDTPAVEIPDWRQFWQMRWRMERRVTTWLARSTLWSGMPVGRIPERKVGFP